MTTVQQGRWTATAEPGAVCFIVGMRVNKLWRCDQWVPVALAMPKMLAELARHRDLGVLGRPRTLVSGRTISVLMHWESFNCLEAYARGASNAHLPAWRRFMKRSQNSGAVGLFHETYVIAEGGIESLYVNMVPISLGDAHGTVQVTAEMERAKARMAARAASEVTF